MINYQIDERGIKISDTLYRFRDLTSFWIDSHGNRKKLYVEANILISPLLVLPLLESDGDNIIREFLASHLTEEEIHEPWSHKIMARFGF